MAVKKSRHQARIPNRSSKQFLRRSLTFIGLVFLTGSMVQSTTPSYGYRGLVHHHLDSEFSFSSENRLASVTLANYFLFVSAWLKVSGPNFNIRAAQPTPPDYLLLPTSFDSCSTIQDGSWIHLTQAYSYQSDGNLVAFGYFRSRGDDSPSCSSACGSCTNGYLGEVFGSSFSQTVTNQNSLPGILYTFKVEKKAKVSQIERITSGLILRDSDKVDNLIANVLTSGQLQEVTAKRIYFGNFNYTSQNHLFLQDPLIPAAGDPVKYSEKDFYKSFEKLGFQLGIDTEVRIRAQTNLFDQSNGQLSKSFCFKATFGTAPSSTLSNQNDYLYQQTRIEMSSNTEFIIKFSLVRASTPELKPRIIVELQENSVTVQDSEQDGIYGEIALRPGNLIQMSFCFSIVLAKVSSSQSQAYLYVTARAKQRQKPSSDSPLSAVDIQNKGVEFVESYTFNHNLANSQPNIYFLWSCSDPTKCSDKPFYLQDYMEFIGGHSDLYSEETQSRQPNPDKIYEKSNHFLGGGSSRACISCNQGNAWDLTQKKCRDSSYFFPDGKGDCWVVQEIDFSRCQSCLSNPQLRGIPSFECLPEAGCQAPSYNYFGPNRCDYCLNAKPDNCRCNQFQNSKDNSAVENSTYCQCKIQNCKPLFVFLTQINFE